MFCSVLPWPGLSVWEKRGAKGHLPLQPGWVPGKSGLLAEEPELQPPRIYVLSLVSRGCRQSVTAVLEAAFEKESPEMLCAKEGIVLHNLIKHSMWVSKLSRTCFWELCKEMQMEEMVVNKPCVPQLKLCRRWDRLCAVLVPKEEMEEREASFANWYLLI